MTDEKTTDKTFYVEGWGEVGEANLSYGVVAIISGKQWQDLEIGESCDVVTRGDVPERITRTR